MLKILKFRRTNYNREANEIDYSELQKMTLKGAILIDVRSLQEYREGHLKNAISIPEYELKKNIGKIAKDKNDLLILYCTYGGRSRKAYNILRRMGFNNIYVLKGGLDGL